MASNQTLQGRESRKRRAPDVYQIDSKGPGAREHKLRRNPRRKSTTSLLLGLPAELRAKILKELLCGEGDVLHMNRDFFGTPQVYPLILATCRQLNHEGRVFFYANRINIDVKNRAYDIQRRLRELVGSISVNFTKIGFTVEDEEETTGEYDCRVVVHEWAQFLRTRSHWSDVRIEMLGPHSSLKATEDGVTKSSESCGFALTPFRIVRRLERAEVVGVSKRFAEQLVMLMLGNTPVIELMDMYQSLNNWLDRIWQRHDDGILDFVWDDAIGSAHDAALRGDAHSFANFRQAAIASFEQEYNPFLLDIYENDPDPLRAEHKALTDNAQDVLEERVDEAKDEPEVRKVLLEDLDKQIKELQSVRQRLVAASM
jgi:hypothetical protein